MFLPYHQVSQASQSHTYGELELTDEIPYLSHIFRTKYKLSHFNSFFYVRYTRQMLLAETACIRICSFHTGKTAISLLKISLSDMRYASKSTVVLYRQAISPVAVDGLLIVAWRNIQLSVVCAAHRNI
jgi:hypothetical protein